MASKESKSEEDGGTAGYGEVTSGILTRQTAGDELRYKWDFLFGNLSPHQRENIQMDQVCLFSITDHKTAQK